VGVAADGGCGVRLHNLLLQCIHPALQQQTPKELCAWSVCAVACCVGCRHSCILCLHCTVNEAKCLLVT